MRQLKLALTAVFGLLQILSVSAAHAAPAGGMTFIKAPLKNGGEALLEAQVLINTGTVLVKYKHTRMDLPPEKVADVFGCSRLFCVGETVVEENGRDVEIAGFFTDKKKDTLSFVYREPGNPEMFRLRDVSLYAAKRGCNRVACYEDTLKDGSKVVGLIDATNVWVELNGQRTRRTLQPGEVVATTCVPDTKIDAICR